MKLNLQDVTSTVQITSQAAPLALLVVKDLFKLLQNFIFLGFFSFF